MGDVSLARKAVVGGCWKKKKGGTEGKKKRK